MAVRDNKCLAASEAGEKGKKKASVLHIAIQGGRKLRYTFFPYMRPRSLLLPNQPPSSSAEYSKIYITAMPLLIQPVYLHSFPIFQ